MHNLLKSLLLVWQPANLILVHNIPESRAQPLITHANIFFSTLVLLLLKSSRTNEDLLNNSLIN